jgi:hypothetical protein
LVSERLEIRQYISLASASDVGLDLDIFFDIAVLISPESYSVSGNRGVKCYNDGNSELD